MNATVELAGNMQALAYSDGCCVWHSVVGITEAWAFPRDYVRGNNRLRHGQGLSGANG